jgi:hypothetical protein
LIKRIVDGDTLIAIVGSLEDAAWGNKFVTENELPMQMGIMRLNKSEIQNHVHKIRNRQLKTISNEFHMVIRGRAMLRLFNKEKELVAKQMLCPNMFCILYSGGHGYEIIRDDTLMVEVKLGAYSSVDDDKEKF